MKQFATFDMTMDSFMIHHAITFLIIGLGVRLSTLTRKRVEIFLQRQGAKING